MDRRRFSARRKTQAVLRLLRGEDLDTLSRERGVAAATLSGEQLPWIRTFATVAEPVEALREFKRTCNERWLLGRHGHRTPSQVRRDLVGSEPAAA